MEINIDDFNKFLFIKRASSKNTVRVCSKSVIILLAWHKQHNLKISSQTIESFLYELKQKGLKNNSINTYHTALNALKLYCIDRGIYTGFYDNFNRLPRNSKQIVLVTYSEMEKVWSYNHQYGKLISPICVDSRRMSFHNNLYYNTLTMFLLLTGARFSEATKLQCKHLTLEENRGKVLFMDTKNHESRYVKFYGELVGRLIKLIEGKKADDLVFTTITGREISAPVYSFDLKMRAEKLGITKNIHPHLLRHTFATLLYTATKDLGLVQMVLGHKDIKTTMKYISLSDDFLDSGLKKHPFFRKYIAESELLSMIEEGFKASGIEEDERFDRQKIATAFYNFMGQLSLAIK